MSGLFYCLVGGSFYLKYGTIDIAFLLEDMCQFLVEGGVDILRVRKIVVNYILGERILKANNTRELY